MQMVSKQKSCYFYKWVQVPKICISGAQLANNWKLRNRGNTLLPPNLLPYTSQKTMVSDTRVISFVLGPMTSSQINSNYERLLFSECDFFNLASQNGIVVMLVTSKIIFDEAFQIAFTYFACFVSNFGDCQGNTVYICNMTFLLTRDRITQVGKNSLINLIIIDGNINSN